MPYIYKSGLQFGINETNIYGGASYVELTQAEYDALSDAEKHNGQIYFITDGNYDFLIVNDSVPIGSIQAYGGVTAPSGWLICDGSAVSRTDYPQLFSAIGTAYGEGDGSTTFNIPDFRGRIAQGAGTLNSISYTLGEQKDAGLPNITGQQKLAWGDASGGGIIMQPSEGNGAFTLISSANAPFSKGTASGTYYNILAIDASRSSPIYGNSSTVQPNATVTNYIIKAKNPSVTSGQQLQAMELAYPVGSYFETSDSEFDPNVEWGGTWTLVSSKDAYVVDEGTDGIWKYRKWSDGNVELWGKTTPVSYAMINAYGSSYYANLARISFPTNMLLNSPTLVGVRSQEGGSTGLVTLALGSITKDGFGGYVFSASSLTTEVGFAFYAVGRWSNTSETYYRWHRTA